MLRLPRIYRIQSEPLLAVARVMRVLITRPQDCEANLASMAAKTLDTSEDSLVVYQFANWEKTDPLKLHPNKKKRITHLH
jgi:hypothetical protein